MKRVVVLIIEESYFLRRGITVIIREIYPNSQIRESSDVVSALEWFMESKPDIVIGNSNILMDTRIKKLKNRNGKIRWVEISRERRRVVHDGFNTSIFINDSQQLVEEKLREVFSAIDNYNSQITKGLTRREEEILKHIVKGETNKEIADNLFISAHTVTTHRKNITRKLGIKTVSGLMVYALLNNIVQINDLEDN